MSKLLIGSLCVDDIYAASKKNHSAFNKGKNGKTYVNVAVWLNDEKDKYGDHASIQLSAKKDSNDDKVYIGNLKVWESLNQDEVKAAPSRAESRLNDDLPF